MSKRRKIRQKVAGNPPHVSEQLWTFKWFDNGGWKPWKTDRNYDFPLFDNYWLAWGVHRRSKMAGSGALA